MALEISKISYLSLPPVELRPISLALPLRKVSAIKSWSLVLCGNWLYSPFKKKSNSVSRNGSPTSVAIFNKWEIFKAMFSAKVCTGVRTLCKAELTMLASQSHQPETMSQCTSSQTPSLHLLKLNCVTIVKFSLKTEEILELADYKKSKLTRYFKSGTW